MGRAGALRRQSLLARLPGAALLAAALLAAAAGLAQDVVVEGCNERQPGEVGVWEVVANVGAVVEVPITVNASSDIDALGLELNVPPGLFAYVRTDPGDLTAGFDLFGGHWFGASSKVRIVAGASTAIAAGSVGRLAVVVLEVVAPGAGAFGTSAFADDLAGYVSCEDVHGTSRITPTEWGRVKALYRTPR